MRKCKSAEDLRLFLHFMRLDISLLAKSVAKDYLTLKQKLESF